MAFRDLGVDPRDRLVIADELVTLVIVVDEKLLLRNVLLEDVLST